MDRILHLLYFLGALSVCSGSLRIKSRAVIRGQAQQQDWRQSETLHGAVLKSQTDISGKCSQAAWSNKLVVAARYDEDVSWMAAYLVPWLPFLIYSLSGDQAATHKTLSDKGREAQAYLQFILDYYDCLPQEMAFIHAHRMSKHSPDMLEDLKRLKWGSVPGYVSLSRQGGISKFFFSEPEKHKPDPTDHSETAHWMEFAYQQNLRIKAAWPELFQDSLGQIPDLLTAPCCGQFVVTRSRVQQHPRAFFEKSVEWLQRTELDSFWAGLIFEHTWAYLFGAGADYTAPDECALFTCDRNGSRVMPPWESQMSRSCLQNTK